MSDSYNLDLEVINNIIEVNLEFVPYVDETKLPKIVYLEYSPEDWVISGTNYSITIPQESHKIAKLANLSVFLGDSGSSLYSPGLMDYTMEQDSKSIILYSEQRCWCKLVLFGDAIL